MPDECPINPIAMSAGLPSTVLPPADPRRRGPPRRRARTRRPGPARRRSPRSLAGYPRFLDAWATLGDVGRRPRSSATPPTASATTAASTRCGPTAGAVGLRALVGADERGFLRCARRARRDGRGDRRARRGRADRPVPRPARPRPARPRRLTAAGRRRAVRRRAAAGWAPTRRSSRSTAWRWPSGWPRRSRRPGAHPVRVRRRRRAGCSARARAAGRRRSLARRGPARRRPHRARRAGVDDVVVVAACDLPMLDADTVVRAVVGDGARRPSPSPSAAHRPARAAAGRGGHRRLGALEAQFASGERRRARGARARSAPSRSPSTPAALRNVNTPGRPARSRRRQRRWVALAPCPSPRSTSTSSPSASPTAPG